MTELAFSVQGADGATLQGDPVEVAHSDKLTFVIDVTGRNPGATYRCTLTHDGQARLNAVEIPSGGKTYPIASANAAEHGGAWTAAVLASDGVPIADKTLNLEVAAEPAPAPTEPPGVYDKGFAIWVGIVLTVLFVAVAVALFGVLANRKKSDVPVVWILAFGLLTIGVLLAAAGAFFVALEVRGKLISAEDKTVLSERGLDVKDAATLVDAVGKLRGPTAVLLLAAVCLIGSAWIGFGATRPDSPATPTATTTSLPPDE